MSVICQKYNGIHHISYCITVAARGKEQSICFAPSNPTKILGHIQTEFDDGFCRTEPYLRTSIVQNMQQLGPILYNMCCSRLLQFLKPTEAKRHAHTIDTA